MVTEESDPILSLDSEGLLGDVRAETSTLEQYMS